MAPTKNVEKRADKESSAATGRGVAKASKSAANATKKGPAVHYDSRRNAYSRSFREVMLEWMRSNFPDEVRENVQPSNEGQRREARNDDVRPSLTQYLGWLDSLENRDEANVNNTLTKRHWENFCEQPENKKMAASWKLFARDARTCDGLYKFHPDLSNVEEENLYKHTRLHPLISFPSPNDFRLKAATAGDESVPDAADDDHECKLEEQSGNFDDVNGPFQSP